METILPVSVIVGFVASPVISALSREKWSSGVKALCAFIVCLIAAAGTAWYEASLNFHDYRLVFVTVFSAAIASYHLLWKPSGGADTISQKTG